jgi:hypothetical protein
MMIVLGLAGLALVKAREFFATKFPTAKERVDKARERIEPALREATKSVASAIGDAAAETSEAPNPQHTPVTSSSRPA